MIPQAGGDSGFFPPAVRGWALAPEEAAYTPEDLYRYIDGASELYISYGFVNLLTRIYQRPGQPDIVVDFFDMGAPANAFGIFAHSQEVPTREIGQDSEYLDGLLRFWQGRYYVSLLCSPETPESRAAVMELGRQLARRLPAATVRPEILSLLPPAGLLAASIRLFHHHAWQNTYRFIADGDILGIDAGAEAVLAKYEQDGERSLLLLVRYPERGFAERAFAGLVRKFNFPAQRRERRSGWMTTTISPSFWKRGWLPPSGMPVAPPRRLGFLPPCGGRSPRLKNKGTTGRTR